MAGQPGARRAWSRRHALDRLAREPGDRPGRPRRRAAPAQSSARRQDDPVRVGRGGVLELDLDPDDRAEPDSLGCRGKAHDAVQPVVIGHGEPRQAQRSRSLGHVLDRRGAVEEREVGVAVELGVGRRHEARLALPNRRGPVSIEQTFYQEPRNTMSKRLV